MERKIFGIGLSRTGTLSLTNALQILGLQAVHYPRIEDQVARGTYRLDHFEPFDALTDTPVAAIFPQLDETYPKSKFILTTRAKDEWLDSCEAFFTLKDESEIDEGAFVFRLAVYGCHRFNRSRFSYAYDRHQREVLRYFEDRADDLLVLDLFAGDGWPRLCPFLDLPVPSAPFPHDNSIRYLRQSRWAADRLE